MAHLERFRDFKSILISISNWKCKENFKVVMDGFHLKLWHYCRQKRNILVISTVSILVSYISYIYNKYMQVI